MVSTASKARRINTSMEGTRGEIMQQTSSMKNQTLKEFHIRQKKGMRLLLFPLPFQGHITPMLQLANILYSKGFSITIIHTSFNSPNPSNYPELVFHSIHQGLSEEEANEAFSRVADLVALLASINITCVEPFREALGRLISENLEEDPVACLIADAGWHFAQAVADSLHLPRIVLRTSNVCSFLAFESLPLFCQNGYIPLEASKAEERIPEFPHLKVKDLPHVKTRNQEDMVYLLASMMKAIKGSRGLIWNTCRELERSDLVKSSQVFKIPSFPLGPFHKHFPCISKSSLLGQDQTSISWLNTQPPKSVLYVSFGSIATVTKAESLEIAWGLANSQQPFLWVVRPRSVENSEWIEFLPDEFDEAAGGRGYIVKWAPQEEVLAHPATGGFWTHCGWNSTLESMCEGVPMICAPSFGDQLMNARYVSDVWRIGIHLEGKMERGHIEKAVNELMAEEEGAGMRERVGALKAKMECCLEPGGSSYEALNSLVDHILSL